MIFDVLRNKAFINICVCKPTSLWQLLSCLGCLCLVACNEEPTKVTQALVVPERASSTYITDQVAIAGQELSLWFIQGRCQLQTKHPKIKTEPILLRGKAPCYFIKSPGTTRVQIYQRDKTTRVLGVLGTPVTAASTEQRCGTDLEGIVVNAAGNVRLSHSMSSGTQICANQGLNNTQYELFAQD